ncbi:MAG TPA: hypothetical protein VFE32_17470 [Puia sp.]|nr:hypothetical protein [Puia sp.]
MKKILFFALLFSCLHGIAQEGSKNTIAGDGDRWAGQFSDTPRFKFLKGMTHAAVSVDLLLADALAAATNPILFSQTANGAALTGTSATNIMGATGTGSLTIPANTLQVGQTIILEGEMLLSTAASSIGTFTIGPSIAGTTTVSWGPVLPNGASNTPVHYIAKITILTTGSGGTVTLSQIFTVSGQVPYEFLGASSSTTYSINTTVSNAIGLVAQWGTGSINSIQTVPTFTMKVQ